jgi:hypothetical protein
MLADAPTGEHTALGCADQLGGRKVAVAALRMASCASFMSSSAVVSVLICPLAPTAIASATTATLSGASNRNTPSCSPNAHQIPRSVHPSDSADRLGGVFEPT